MFMSDLEMLEKADFVSAVRFDQEGLVPAIIQDAEDQAVLMLGYMNRESLQITLNTGRVTFWSRSRKKLWTKGETSGNFLNVVEIFADCDRDALLIHAKAQCPTCHTNNCSCFSWKLVQ